MVAFFFFFFDAFFEGFVPTGLDSSCIGESVSNGGSDSENSESALVEIKASQNETAANSKMISAMAIG